MKEQISTQVYTVSQVASLAQRTPGRIRQICDKLGIGIKVNANLRLLSFNDAAAIVATVQSVGYKKKSPPPTIDD